MSVNDINNIQDRITKGELLVDNTHVHYGQLDSALARFNDEQKYSFLVAPDIIRDTSNALSMATMRGVITHNREYLDKFARDIKDKKVTEADIDRVVVVENNDNSAKKYLKGLWSKLIDKSQDAIVDMLIQQYEPRV
jgi:N-acyl-D-aspartate/D-glutamate deacylase